MRVPAILRHAEAPAIHDLDCPSTVAVHHRIIRSKPFLESVYRSFYREVVRNLPAPRTGIIVEIGSGAGFLNDILPDVVTSDVMPIDNIDVCFSGHAMPLHDGSIDALVMVNVFHHIPDTLAFLREASRCLVPGGRLVMVEPANTPWSRFVFRTFHHEAFDPQAGWGLSTSGPLSSANGALPWIVFERDRHERLVRECPSLRVASIAYHSPFRYLISGGLTLRQLAPSSWFPVCTFLEWALTPFMRVLGMFMTITVERV